MNNHYVEYILELLTTFGNVTAKRMFGGYGIYKEKIIFALIADNELYFKVDATNRNDYKLHNSTQLIFESKGKKLAMPYWKVPIEILENEDMLIQFAEKSYNISLLKKS